MTDVLIGLCLFLVLLGMVPTSRHSPSCCSSASTASGTTIRSAATCTPRVAFLLPAWNEADVLGASIDALMSIDYPPGAWRLYIVDDASTDHTPEVMRQDGAVSRFGLPSAARKGGQGKAHTLNHGLKTVLAEDWAEAVMIMDADVLFEAMTLRRMVRHLADPEIGGVTAYVKEGSHPGSLLSRFIAFEYITAQAAARRSQNVMGGLACMAAARSSTAARISSRSAVRSTPARWPRTPTPPFQTQLAGRRVLIDANAVVWAEEPDSLTALWKQRLRWGRGNLQITRAFSDLWFRPGRNRLLGNPAFGILWFSISLMPLFMFGLDRADRPLSISGPLGRRQAYTCSGASPSSPMSFRRCSPSRSIRRRRGGAGSRASPFPDCSLSASWRSPS